MGFHDGRLTSDELLAESLLSNEQWKYFCKIIFILVRRKD